MEKNSGQVVHIYGKNRPKKGDKTNNVKQSAEQESVESSISYL